MKLRDWLKQLGRGHTVENSISDAAIVDLFRYLQNCEEMGCEEVFGVLDQYAEIEVRKEDAARLMPLVREHLDMCDECCDEYEALLDVLAKASESEKP